MCLAKVSLGRSVKGSLKSSILAIVAGALCAAAIGQVNGQSNTTISQAEAGVAKTPAYDVVSIRRPKGDPESGGIGDLPDGFRMRNLTLKSLISDAYGIVRDDQISGWPGWAASARFDIEAKMDVETVDALHKLSRQQQEVQRQLMLQSLLADRFKLKVHRATTVRTTYELVLAKGGLKMKEDNPPSDRDGIKWQEGVSPSTDWMMSDGKISGHAMPISILADHLPDWVHSEIVDKTGLTGRYDVVLTWDPKDEPAPNSTEPSLFTALEEQLGLRLIPTRATVETLVIDHLEMPSEN
jgi:uncharacterized protein (TIGR03435 family)